MKTRPGHVDLWTPGQDAHLERCWYCVSMADLEQTLGRSESAIRQRAYHLLGTTRQIRAHGRKKGERRCPKT